MASAPASDRITVWRNARLATMSDAASGLGLISAGAVAARDGRIVYAGSEAELPAELLRGAEAIDCEGRLITPGLIDCHTHLVHAGNRANEFEMRLAGATYEEVAKAGGGIVSSVKIAQGGQRGRACPPVAATPGCADRRGRHDDRDQVRLWPRPRERGEVARARRAVSAMVRNVTVRTSFLGAHALPLRSQRRQGRLHRSRRQRDAAGDRRATGWPTQSTGFARASPFRRSKSRACSTRRRRSACR